MFKGFKTESFDLLQRYSENGDASNYSSNEFDPLIRDPFKELRDFSFNLLSKEIPEYGLSKKHSLSKHVSRGNKLYSHFWCAIFRDIKESKSRDIQFFWRIDPNRFCFGLYVGHEVGADVISEIIKNLENNHTELIEKLTDIKSPRPLNFSEDDTNGFTINELSLDEAFNLSRWKEKKSINLYFKYSRDEVAELGESLRSDIEVGLKPLIEIYKKLVSKPGEKNTAIIEVKKETIENLKSNSFENIADSLNVIYYGAPGTGKTYAVKRHAYNIVEGGKSEFNQNRFDEHLSKGRISFVTFHPNYGYENFIEGLFPDVESISGLSYKLNEGILKRIVSSALKSLLIPEKKSAWPAFEDVYAMYLASIADAGGEIIEETSVNSKKFTVEESETGGLVFKTMTGNPLHCSKKRLKGLYDYLAMNDIKTPNRADLDKDRSLRAYTVVVLRKIIDLGKSLKIEKNNSSYDFDPYEILESGRYTINKNPEKYVLIIDEINRGNIPAIFGELITLLENSKRLGRKDASTLSLSLSGQLFTIPSNLYVLGTMNCADKSVEALDIALRRRFVFVNQAPDYGLLERVENDDVDLSLMLKAINHRIRSLKGFDYIIGHSYFLDAHTTDDLKLIFKNHIIPLLFEYFYNDTAKVKAIIGESFFKKMIGHSSVRSLNPEIDIDISSNEEISEMINWDFTSIYE